MATSVERTWHFIAPIFNFVGETADEISLGENLRIRMATAEDQGRSAPGNLFRFMMQSHMGLSSMVPSRWLIETSQREVSTSSVIDTGSIQAKFGRVIGALHLEHDEIIAFPFVLGGVGDPPNYGMGLSGFGFPPIQAWTRPDARPFRLNRSEISDVTRHLATIEDLFARAPTSPVLLALNRLASSHGRVSDPDQVIDAAIALEALLLRGAAGEHAYRLSLRGSHLLGGTSYQLHSNFSLLRGAYDRRNKIVHGGTDPLEPSVSEIRAITRRILRQFIELGPNLDQAGLLDRLDSEVIEGRTAENQP